MVTFFSKAISFLAKDFDVKTYFMRLGWILAIVFAYKYYGAKEDISDIRVEKIKIENRLNQCKADIFTQNELIKRGEIDLAAKEEEYKAAMAVKPKYKTTYIYEVSRDLNVSDERELADLRGLIDEYVSSKVEGGSK